MTVPVYTPSMLASALSHYDRRHEWVRGMCKRTGKAFVQFESSRKPPEGKPQKVYRANETHCTCPGFDYHHGICSHVLAVNMETSAARLNARKRRTRTEPNVTTS